MKINNETKQRALPTNHRHNTIHDLEDEFAIKRHDSRSKIYEYHASGVTALVEVGRANQRCGHGIDEASL